MTDSTLKVTGSYKNLNAIAQFVTEWALKAELDERTIHAAQMAVDEASTNIIAHGYGGEGKGDIQLECKLVPAGLQVTITDFGQPFLPESMLDPAADAPPETLAEGGLGLFLLRQLVDDLQFEFGDEQNKLIMILEKQND